MNRMQHRIMCGHGVRTRNVTVAQRTVPPGAVAAGGAALVMIAAGGGVASVGRRTGQ